MKLKVIYIVGSQPPEFCGVGGYVSRLSRECSDRDIQTLIHFQGPWRLRTILYQWRQIRSKIQEPSVLHFHYPSVGFGRSLAGPLLGVIARLSGRSVVSTIHEFSQVHILRRLASLPLLLTSNHLIFSNRYERNAVLRYLPFLVSKCSVIPVGSTIQKGSQSKSGLIREITYFGLIRPDKGIEAFIEVAHLAKSRAVALKFRIIGARDPRFLSYFDSLQEKSMGTDIEWVLDRTESEVAELLSAAEYVYLPFPDGASDRRTSLMAALANGTVVLTTKGVFTDSEMERRLNPLPIPHTADEALDRIIAETHDVIALRKQQVVSVEVADQYSWSSIASRHKTIYENIARGRSTLT